MKVITNTDEFPDYLKDASNFRGNCDALLMPVHEEEIQEAVEFAGREGLPLTIAGNGTGLTGGRVPQGGAVLSLEKIPHRILFDEEKKCVTVSAGLPLIRLLEAVDERGLFFPPDPTEKLCACGGIVATNASGAKSFSYGAVRNFVESLDLILADGSSFTVKRGEFIASGNTFGTLTFLREGNLTFSPLPMPEVKNASGYFLKSGMDLIDLFIGSEGTLALTRNITFRLLPKPAGILSCLANFVTEEGALDFIQELRLLSGEQKPLAIEYFDQGALRLLKADYHFTDDRAAAAVWFEFETAEEIPEPLLDILTALFAGCGGKGEIMMASSPGERRQLELMRHAAAYKVNEYIASRGVRKLGTDTAVPAAAFRDFYFESRNLVKKSGLDYVIYGHFGNSHIHLNMLPENQTQFEAGKEIYAELCKNAILRGGTVSAEHGIGKIKKDYLRMMYGEAGIGAMKEVKRVFDPGFRLGRGNLFDPD
ncbi:MAG: FAD-binding oxidoreductase [Ignavibacteriales bacterium]|nr:MAG: FAD-binding oxidoreductase [Ignavibacteriales bacterium]